MTNDGFCAPVSHLCILNSVRNTAIFLSCNKLLEVTLKVQVTVFVHDIFYMKC